MITPTGTQMAICQSRGCQKHCNPPNTEFCDECLVVQAWRETYSAWNKRALESYSAPSSDISPVVSRPASNTIYGPLLPHLQSASGFVLPQRSISRFVVPPRPAPRFVPQPPKFPVSSAGGQAESTPAASQIRTRQVPNGRCMNGQGQVLDRTCETTSIRRKATCDRDQPCNQCDGETRVIYKYLPDRNHGQNEKP